jgi:transcriptional regulator with XRE-family HTH domain
MGEISPIPGKSADPKRFELFKIDLRLLLSVMTQEELAKGMGVTRSNINKYVKGGLPITKSILNKFYAAWQERIKAENAKMRHEEQLYPPPDQKKDTTLTQILTILQRIEKKIDDQTSLPPKGN